MGNSKKGAGAPATSGNKPGNSRTRRQRRGEAALMGCDPFAYLCERFTRAKSTAVKDRLALELMPYIKPKLKAVDMQLGGDFNVTVSIGGAEDPVHLGAQAHETVDGVHVGAQSHEVGEY